MVAGSNPVWPANYNLTLFWASNKQWNEWAPSISTGCASSLLKFSDLYFVPIISEESDAKFAIRVRLLALVRSALAIFIKLYLLSHKEQVVVDEISSIGPSEDSVCDWCKKPRNEWTSRLRWWGLKKFYCSMECYSAGEYKLNRYLCSISSIVLGFASLFLISMFLTNLTSVTIMAIVSVIIIWLLFSGASLTCIVLGRNKRMLRNSEESDHVNELRNWESCITKTPWKCGFYAYQRFHEKQIQSSNPVWPANLCR